MKNIFCSLLLLSLFATQTFGQNPIPNPGFEVWDSVPGTRPYHEPESWLSKNRFYQDTNRIYSFRSSQAHTGNHSLLLTSAIDSGHIYPSENSAFYIKGSFHQNFVVQAGWNGLGFLQCPKKPKKISGWYKYVKDTPIIVGPNINYVIFLARAGGRVEPSSYISPCGYAYKIDFAPTDTFTYFSIPFNYSECEEGVQIDSFRIAVGFNSKNKSMNPTGKFWLDDLEIEYEEMTSVAPQIENEFEILPNPGTDKLYFSGEIDASQPIHVVDAQGKSINCPPLGNQGLDTGNLPKGLYLIRVFQKASKESGPCRWVERRWVKM